MSDTPETQREDAAPQAPPTDTGSQSNAGDLDSLLGEYERATADPVQAPPEQVADAPHDDAQLQEWMDGLFQEARASLQADKEHEQLKSEYNALRDAVRQAQEQAEFEKYAAEVQNQLPEHLPPDYAQTQMLAMASQNPELVAAYQLRNQDRRAVDLELKKVEAALARLQHDPTADQKKIAALQQYGYRLGLALNAPEILRRATNDIIKRAKAHRPIDPDATADRAMVAAAVRDAHHKIAPEPPPNLGQLSAKEFRDYVKSLGFDAGV